MSWQVLVDPDIDQVPIRQAIAAAGGVYLNPMRVTRMTSREGLLVHQDEELCYLVSGPDDFPERVNRTSINAVLASPKARPCTPS